MPLLSDSQRLPTALCGLLLISLAVQIALPTPEDGGAPARRLPAALLHAPAPAPVSGFAMIAARSLFSPDRTTGASPPGGVAATGQLLLEGVSFAPGAGSATLRTPDGGLHTLRLGEEAGGWRLARTTSDSAVLERGDATQVLHLGAASAPPPLITPPPAAAPSPIPAPFAVHGAR